jgi:hypothetical protein
MDNESRLEEAGDEELEERLVAPPKDTLASLKKLFPGLTAKQYADLDRWYTGYAALILRMYERITNDPDSYTRFFALTNPPSRPSMTAKVDSQAKPINPEP